MSDIPSKRINFVNLGPDRSADYAEIDRLRAELEIRDAANRVLIERNATLQAGLETSRNDAKTLQARVAELEGRLAIRDHDDEVVEGRTRNGPWDCDAGAKAMSDAPNTLMRWGLEWTGPGLLDCKPMHDGYWTPWYLAQAEIDRLRAFVGTQMIRSDFRSADEMRAEIVRLRARVAELEAALRNLREGQREAKNTNIVDYIDAVLEPKP